jgi:hypothetical protein
MTTLTVSSEDLQTVLASADHNKAWENIFAAFLEAEDTHTAGRDIATFTAPALAGLSESEWFARELSNQFSLGGHSFRVEEGRKYDRIVHESFVCSASVHAFVERSTGHVLKAATWKAPARGVRYTNVAAAVEAASQTSSGWAGAYLYK